MKVTNRLHLPEAFVRAVSVERHNAPGCYSATTLNKGVKEIVLQERHWDKLEVDAADQVWATFGSAVHALMQERDENTFSEEKFSAPVSNSTVTGQVDMYDMEKGLIVDWKTASVYKVMMGDFSDWNNQGMTYAWLMTRQGLPVRSCRFVGLLKDHSKSKAARDSSYPQSPVYVYEFDVTPEDLAWADARIEAKVMELEAAERMSDDDIPPCSAAERWADGDKYAVMKNGRKSAVRLFDDLAMAEACAGELGNSHYVEIREAVSRKCENYCACKDFCNFYKNMKGDSK